ncbi:MAG: hypothetical protein R3C18_19025 [Planctomycetaceae bacterium]
MLRRYIKPSNCGLLAVLMWTWAGWGTSHLLGQDYLAPAPVVSQHAAYGEPIETSVLSSDVVFASSSGQSWIGIDTPTTWSMLDFQNRQGDKQLTLLRSQSESGSFPQVIIGGQMRVSALAAMTNSDDKFPYQGRFPTDFTGSTALDVRVLQSNQNVIAHIAPWATAYVETLFSDVFTFPTFNQGSFQMRQAYAVLGNLDESPFYLFAGKKNVSFGDMRTLSPFTQSMVWHYFGALGEGGGVGYSADGLNMTVTALNGSRGIRVVDSPNKGHIDNVAANGSYEFNLPNGTEIIFGGGYLAGTIYNAAVAEHTNPAVTGPQNGAWDVNGRVRMGNVYLSGEYAATLKPWPATSHRVQAYRAELALDIPIGGVPAWWAVSWSEGIQGASGTEFRSNQQLVLGLELQPSPNVLFTAEYVRSLGFAPLIGITTASDSNVVQDSFVLGLVLAI